MKLYNSQKEVVVQFGKNAMPTFYDSLFEREMESLGISIPPELEKHFDSQKKIYPPSIHIKYHSAITGEEITLKKTLRSAKLFYKALRKWYYPEELEKIGYYWEGPEAT